MAKVICAAGLYLVPALLLQVVPLLEGPVGMALYEFRDGQMGPVGLQAGATWR